MTSEPTHPVSASRRTKAVYDSLASEFGGRYRGPRSRYFDEREGAIIEALAHDARGSSVALDVGCGTGRFFGSLGDRFERSIGLDVSAPMLRAVDSSEGAHLVQGDLTALPFDDGTVDLLLSIGVLESIDAVGAAFEEARRVLRPGGLLIFTCHNREALIPAKNPSYPVARHRLSDLRATLEQLGFTVERSQTTFFVNFRWVWGIDRALQRDVWRRRFIGVLIKVDETLASHPWMEKRGREIIMAARLRDAP